MNYKKIETFFNKYEEGLQDVEVELDKFLYGKWRTVDYEQFGFKTKILSMLTTEQYLIAEFQDQNYPFSPRLKLHYKELGDDVLDIYKIWSEDDSMAYSIDILNARFTVMGKSKKALANLELKKLRKERKLLRENKENFRDLIMQMNNEIEDINIEINRIENALK